MLILADLLATDTIFLALRRKSAPWSLAEKRAMEITQGKTNTLVDDYSYRSTRSQVAQVVQAMSTPARTLLLSYMAASRFARRCGGHIEINHVEGHRPHQHSFLWSDVQTRRMSRGNGGLSNHESLVRRSSKIGFHGCSEQVRHVECSSTPRECDNRSESTSALDLSDADVGLRLSSFPSAPYIRLKVPSSWQ
jgi:hypothetical protein